MPTGIYIRTDFHRRRLSESHIGITHKDRRSPGEIIERRRKSRIRWNRDNPEVLRTADAKWTRAHPDRANAKNALRVARKLSATPRWLTNDHIVEIKAVYMHARSLGLVVDHIIPLRGEIVCGLHVPWNLQSLTKTENLKKGNRL